MSSDTETLLLAVSDDFTVRVGLPPRDYNDSFYDRAAVLNKINNVSRLFSSPGGDLYCVCNGELYVGPMPSSTRTDWLSTAKKVGKLEWGTFKRIFFHPNGDLYATTDDGSLYKGPKPDNENISWMNGQATKIGGGDWQQFEAMLFDSNGVLYAVHKDDYFVRGAPPVTGSGNEWLKSTTKIGGYDWLPMTYFMSFTPDGNLWCVRKSNGNLYCGPPVPEHNPSYGRNAKHLGYSYNQFRCLSFIKDRTVKGVINFEFLPEQGKIVSQSAEVVEEMICDNRKSSSKLQQTFSFSKAIKQTSTFSHEHGFTVGVDTEIKFNAGVPFVAAGGATVKINTSTTHKWSFTETNETQVTYTHSSNVVVDSGKAIRMVASVVKAELNVPYRARIITMFGHEATIEGMWNGVSSYNMTITQEDYYK